MSDHGNDGKRRCSSLTSHASLTAGGFNLERPQVNFARAQAARLANLIKGKGDTQQNTMDPQNFTQYLEQERRLHPISCTT